MSIATTIAQSIGVNAAQVSATIELLDQGATVPFIARYRKERTGSLDEVAIASIRDQLAQQRELEKRKAYVLQTIEEQGNLDDALKQKINEATTLATVEDLYLPYKPRRRTKATVAREQGLEPLAEVLYQQDKTNPETAAQAYVNPEKEVTTVEEALQGARHIIAEWINERQEVRAALRELFLKQATVRSQVIRGKEDEGAKYRDYFDWEESLAKVPSHRLLAMRRGENEMILSLSISPPEEAALALLRQEVLKNNHASTEQVELALTDAYRRLLKPSLETDVRLHTKKLADEEAIRVFAENLQQLLLAPALGEKPVLALDPGFRTGCKVACLNSRGDLLDHATIYPNAPQKQTKDAAETLVALCQKHGIEAIAIGNGTAGRETEAFVRSIPELAKLLIVSVNESGASVYSASDVARREFPDHDVTVRGAVSIGRRLIDPLAELVKVDPKAIGVGQYQHDVDQNALKQGLEDTVVSCVNRVGVEVNTASQDLLSYVSGIGPVLAQNIVEYRTERGGFRNREALLKVPRLGHKAYEQAAGFLRIREGENPLDCSGVHPERYELVARMAADQKVTIEDLMKDAELRQAINLKRYQNEEVGLPTLQDILTELEKPGRDPREKFEAFAFADGVHAPEDLKVGMKLPGIITNVTNFGAFVDVGVHQDGLVHVSHLSDNFVEDPTQAVKVQQPVQVTVMEVDLARQRIALSMKTDPFAEPGTKKKSPQAKKPKKAAKPEDLGDSLERLKNKFRKG